MSALLLHNLNDVRQVVVGLRVEQMNELARIGFPTLFELQERVPILRISGNSVRQNM